MLLPPRSAARLLGLDTGTLTGWAVNRGDKIVSGTARLAVEPRGRRWADLRQALDGLVREHDLMAVYYERSEFIGGGNQALALLDRGGMYAVLEAWAWVWKLPLIPCGPGQAKKSLTGSGRAEKRDMIVAASRLCGEPIGDSNQADAVGVLMFGISHFIYNKI